MDQRGKEEFLQEAERRNERQRNETSQADKSGQQQKKKLTQPVIASGRETKNQPATGRERG